MFGLFGLVDPDVGYGVFGEAHLEDHIAVIPLARTGIGPGLEGDGSGFLRLAFSLGERLI
jgi:hypothetical protein